MSPQRRQCRAKDGRTYSVWRVRWYDGSGVERNRTFGRAADVRAFEAKVRTLKRSEGLAELDTPGRETIAEFIEEWWRLYAVPNLERSTLKVYASLWNTHGLPRSWTARRRAGRTNGTHWRLRDLHGAAHTARRLRAVRVWSRAHRLPGVDEERRFVIEAPLIRRPRSPSCGSDTRS